MKFTYFLLDYQLLIVMRCKQNWSRSNEFNGMRMKQMIFYMVTHVLLRPYTYIHKGKTATNKKQ